ncbi:MAG: hypothetical protein R3C49_20050 [Planctomycetaceae bacterium]
MTIGRCPSDWMLDGKRLETPLIQMAGPAGLVVSMPTHRVHDSQSTKELTDPAAGLGPDHKMPLIRHCSDSALPPSHKPAGHDFPRFLHDAYERGIVFRFFKIVSRDTARFRTWKTSPAGQMRFVRAIAKVQQDARRNEIKET